MDYTRYIPPDPDLVGVMDTAYAAQRRVFEENITTMKEFHVAREEDPSARMVDENGDEVEFFAPEYMAKQIEEMDQSWLKTRAQLAIATNAHQQCEILYVWLRGVFSLSAYSGNSPLLMKFCDAVTNAASNHYERQVGPSSSDEKVVKRLAPSPGLYFREVLPDLCSYTDLAIEALSDIENLTEHAQLMRGLTLEDAAQTPYEVVLRRYCAARQLKPDMLEAIPEEDEAEFVKKIDEFYVQEIFSPFRTIMDVDVLAPELAWFIGATISAIQCEDEEAEKKLCASTGGYTRAFLKNRDVFGEDVTNENHRTVTAILQDPAARERFNEILQSVFEQYPTMALDLGELITAKKDFIRTYLELEPQQAASPSR